MGSFNKSLTSEFTDMEIASDSEVYIDNVGSGFIEIWVGDTAPTDGQYGVKLRGGDNGLTVSLSGSEKLFARTDGGAILAGVE